MTSGETFRPIHYLGNKTRILGDILETVRSASRGNGTVCDPFAGTGLVARAFAKHGPVVAGDIQEYSRVVTSALLNPRTALDIDMEELDALADETRTRIFPVMAGLVEYEASLLAGPSALDPHLSEIVEQGSLAIVGDELSALNSMTSSAATTLAAIAPFATISQHYAGPYFSYAQAIAIDSLNRAIELSDPKVQDVARAALLGAASDISSSAGNHFAQPIKTLSRDGSVKSGGWATRVRRDRSRDVNDLFKKWLERYRQLSPPEHRAFAYRAGFRETLGLVGNDLSAVYADPPYTRDHYSRFYHVLETISLGDSPGVSTVTLSGRTSASRALYRLDRHQSAFSIRTKAQQEFAGLFEAVSLRGVPLILSYSQSVNGTKARPQTRVVTLDRLTELLSQYFKNVRTVAPGKVSHSKFNSAHLNAASDVQAEVLLVASNGALTR